MKVGKLLHTRYRVNDLERTVKFYRDILGLAEVKRHKSPRGSELVFMQADGSEELIELCHFPNSESVKCQPDLTHLAFEVDSLAAFDTGMAISRKAAAILDAAEHRLEQIAGAPDKPEIQPLDEPA